MTALPLEAEDLLKLLNDYAVGGTTLTPGLPDYSRKEVLRSALETRDDWIRNEGVHLNPSQSSLDSALRNMGLLNSESYYEDRVLLLDFDIFDKEGGLKAPKEITPEEIISVLKAEGMPLPYYWLESGTPGNFHMVWVLEDPMEREDARPLVKAIYRHWGADPNYTNSTMRNPVHLSVHAPDKVRWWTEWAEERPLLADLLDLLPTSFEPGKEVLSSGRPSGTSSLSSKYRARLTVPQLEAQMASARDGEGRWKLLTSWVRRKVMEHDIREGRPLSTREMQSLVDRGNQLFYTPMEPRRVALVSSYWTLTRQRIYVAQKRKAGRTNYKAKMARASASREYFKMVDFREELQKFLRGEKTTLPPEVLVRDRNFQGRRTSTKGEVCYAYLAWMMDVQPKEHVNMQTGETREVTGTSQVKNLLCNGKRAGYERNAETPEDGTPLTEEERRAAAEILSVLTSTGTSARMNLGRYIPPIPKYVKEVTYVC